MIKNNYTQTTELSQLKMDDRGFVYVKLTDDQYEFDLTEAKAQVNAIRSLTNNQPALVLIDTRDSLAVPTIEAKRFIASVDKKIAEALVVKSLTNRIVANFYRKMTKHKYPSKVFNCKEAAIKWLLTHR